MFNYAFSGCIGNLGVVPLFSFAVFLFLPDRFNFCLRIVRVCVVFEAISKSLFNSKSFNNKYSYYRGIFLSILPSLVKIFILSTLCTTTVYAQKQDLFLSKGEQIEISVTPLKHFSVGNKEVIKYKYLPRKNKILIRGKSLGFSDLVSWNKAGKKSTYHIYVTSKKEQLKKMEIAQALKSTQLNTQISGDIIYVSGELNSLSNYLIVKNLEQKKIKDLIMDIKLSKSLKNHIIARTYKELYARNFEYVYCHNSSSQIICDYQSDTTSLEILKTLKETFLIQFNNVSERNNFKNFQIQFKVVSIETTDSNLRNSGFNKLQGSLTDLLDTNRLTLETDQIFLEDENVSVKLMATPEINTIMNEDFQVQLGAEVPFKTGQGKRQSTKWKFIGLQMDGKIKQKGQQFLLQYQSFLTRSSGEGVAGPKGKAALFIPLNQHIKLYSVDLKQDTTNLNGIPYLSQVPFLKSLFSKTSESHTSKRVIIYATLREI